MVLITKHRGPLFFTKVQKVLFVALLGHYGTVDVMESTDIGKGFGVSVSYSHAFYG